MHFTASDFFSHLLFEHVEVVYDNSDEEIEREERAANDKNDEIKIRW